jgi:acetoacetate decarboxylase
MKLADVRAKAFAMPLNDPAYPRGPYKFYNREFVVITYRTDVDALREVVPEPLEVAGDTVAYEFIRMPDSTGFGDYTETGQVIPVRFRAADGTIQDGGYVHAMYLDDYAPIAGGREIWGFPKKLATPKISHESETLVCTLHVGSVLCVSATMGYKHHELDPEPLLKALAKPNFMIKIIPHVDCGPRICELVRYYMQDVTLKGAWRGPAALQLFEHAQCDVARLPVREVVSASHYLTDLTLGLGEVVFDYLKEAQPAFRTYQARR